MVDGTVTELEGALHVIVDGVHQGPPYPRQPIRIHLDQEEEEGGVEAVTAALQTPPVCPRRQGSSWWRSIVLGFAHKKGAVDLN